ncbi:Hypothetical predicted protein, partial [Pelobates cultripes]
AKKRDILFPLALRKVPWPSRNPSDNPPNHPYSPKPKNPSTHDHCKIIGCCRQLSNLERYDTPCAGPA